MKTIEIGSQEVEVMVLQRLLFKSNFPIDRDGDFGPQTLNAVKGFQIGNNINADGIVGDDTWNALFDYTKGITHEGIDISHYEFEDNKMVDLNYVADNFWFCYTKGTEGPANKDPKFNLIFNGLEKRQVLRGAFHFLRDGNIQNQIDNFNSLGIDYSQKGILPPVLDVEYIPKASNLNMVVHNMKTWLQTIENETHKKPIIYTNQDTWDSVFKSPAGFETYPLWVASYTTGMKPLMPTGWKKYDIWQYTEKGTVKGASGVDLNHSIITYQYLLQLAGF